MKKILWPLVHLSVSVPTWRAMPDEGPPQDQYARAQGIGSSFFGSALGGSCVQSEDNHLRQTSASQC